MPLKALLQAPVAINVICVSYDHIHCLHVKVLRMYKLLAYNINKSVGGVVFRMMSNVGLMVM